MDERTLQAKNRPNITRRRFSAGLCLGLLTALSGCGGTTESVADTADGAPGAAGSTFGAPKAWDVVPTHALTLSPGATFNLATTLPPNVAVGGVFQVDSSGAPLPAGITLAPAGVLTVSSSATGTVAGVVFRYIPPA